MTTGLAIAATLFGVLMGVSPLLQAVAIVSSISLGATGLRAMATRDAGDH